MRIRSSSFFRRGPISRRPVRRFVGWCFGLQRHLASLAGKLVAWRFGPVAAAGETTTAAVVACWTAFVTFLLAISAGVAAGFGTVAEVALAFLRVERVVLILVLKLFIVTG